MFDCLWGVYQTHNIVLYNSLATYMYIYTYNISHPEQLQHLLTIIDPAMPNYGVLVVSTAVEYSISVHIH